MERLTPALREAARLLPAPLRRVGKRLLPQARPVPVPAPVSPPLPGFPDDVADAESVRHLLLGNAAVFADPAEAANYLEDALQRFRVTMALLPSLPIGAKVLELGANPYFITRLLRRRGLEVTCANWFGEGQWPSGRGRQAIPIDNGEEAFEFDHFNIETTRFPYRDGTFSLALMCEILEHLPADPIHALAELHRVLEKDRGILVVTTPNAARTDLLAAILRGDNVYESMSGYGAYGRHNREYTVAELERLLSDLGYQVERIEALDVHSWRGLADWPAQADPANRADNLFCVARAVGETRWRYPRWLYTSSHNLYGRVVRPDLRVGYNDDLQSAGLSDPDEADPTTRWTTAKPVQVLLSPDFSGSARLVVEGRAERATGQQTRMSVVLPAAAAQWEVEASGQAWRHEVDLRCGEGRQELELIASGPAVGISRIALERPASP